MSREHLADEGDRIAEMVDRWTGGILPVGLLAFVAVMVLFPAIVWDVLKKES